MTVLLAMHSSLLQLLPGIIKKLLRHNLMIAMTSSIHFKQEKYCFARKFPLSVGVPPKNM